MEDRTRRSLLGWSATAMAALAGCGGDDGSAATATPTSTATATAASPTATATQTETQTPTATATATSEPLPTSLSLGSVEFCSEQPTGYEQYTPQPDASYEPTDTVWIYMEPSTTGTRDAGEGQVAFSYQITWTISDPDGSEIETLSRRAENTVAESTDLSEVYLWVNFSPPEAFDPGAHSVQMEVRDRIADTTASTDLAFTVKEPLKQAEGSFGIPKIIFTKSEASGYRSFERQSDAEYDPTETIWYYYEVNGIHYRETADKLLTDVTILETVTGPEGDTWVGPDYELPISNEFSADTDPSRLFIADFLDPEGEMRSGPYTIFLEITDGYTGETKETTGTCTVTE